MQVYKLVVSYERHNDVRYFSYERRNDVRYFQTLESAKQNAVHSGKWSIQANGIHVLRNQRTLPLAHIEVINVEP